jgi:putative DNA primase/helicase
MSNGVLHIPTRSLIPPTPNLFATHGVQFPFDPNAPAPEHWLRFLDDLFAGDDQQRELLQDWMGYCLAPDTRQHKMMLMVGPPRSGKGTIAHVTGEIVGRDNICAPTTNSLVGEFGLQPLLGKTLAIIGDARFSGNGVATVTERLLSISGEDSIDVNRKHQPILTVRLPTRFMILSNELPRLNDTSTALAKRFIILQLKTSFLGREDLRLKERLNSELPGIFNWALEGHRRLNERGHFIQPESSRDAVQEIEDLSSPVANWFRQRCTQGDHYRADVKDAYADWSKFCEGNGIKDAGQAADFGRKLRAVLPGLKTKEGTHGKFYPGFRLGKDHLETSDF